jgi:predicted Holliday junction resolvase-like endonuclease
MMADTNVNERIGSNKNAIIIAVTIVVLAAIFMFYRDRQQKRNLQLEMLDTQVDVWDEWGMQQQNRRLNNKTARGGGKIL